MINAEHGESDRIAGKKRFVRFAVAFSLVIFAVLLRYGYFMLVNPRSSRPVITERPAGRGPILDRNGRLLAFETRLGNITLWKPNAKDPDALSEYLSPLLELSPAELLATINTAQGDFVYLKKQVNDSIIKLVVEGINEGRLPGVGVEPVVGRIYPERNLASQIIGFVGDGNIGRAGIEYAFDRELKTEAAPGIRGGAGGSQVFLTLDVEIQNTLENIAAKVLAENKAEAVMFTAMDPRTGDILGSASLPNYDPNNFQNSDEASRSDRPSAMNYEPGSVFKVFSLAALLDSGAISGNTFFTCNGRYERTTARGEKIIINCMGAHGNVSARDIIIHSCNAGAAYAADRLDSRTLYDNLLALGFGARTGAGLPGETAGILRPPERWSERSKPTLVMGQELSVSALQMLQAAGAIANDGVLVPPRIISKIVAPDGKTLAYEAGEPRRVFEAETARAMRSYMTDVTSSIGTGWRANVEDLSLAVKTGTAQLFDANTGTYSRTDHIASCMALLPADSPSLVLYLVIVKPQGASYLGGQIAAPPMREAAEELINYLGIPRGKNPQIIHSGAVPVPPIPYPAVGETVPDFTGAAKRQLLPLLSRDDIRLQIYGDGWVVRQSPEPGTPLDAETVIVLELE